MRADARSPVREEKQGDGVMLRFINSQQEPFFVLQLFQKHKQF